MRNRDRGGGRGRRAALWGNSDLGTSGRPQRVRNCRGRYSAPSISSNAQAEAAADRIEREPGSAGPPGSRLLYSAGRVSAVARKAIRSARRYIGRAGRKREYGHGRWFPAFLADLHRRTSAPQSSTQRRPRMEACITIDRHPIASIRRARRRTSRRPAPSPNGARDLTQGFRPRVSTR